MSVYNFYAKYLDEAFKKARTAYTNAYDAMEKARVKHEDAQKWHKESREGENEQRRRVAELAYLQAKANFEEVRRGAWAQYDREAQDLTRRFQKTLAEDTLLDSDSLDSAAVTLLESGIMNAADFEGMIAKFDGNSTMTRLASKYIRAYADRSKDSAERGRMYQLADATANGASRKEREWNSLLSAAHTYSGRQTSDNPDPGFVVAMAEKWDDEAPQAAVANF